MAALEIRKEIIQYVPYMSFVHPSFWHTFTDVKLNHDKLCESTKQIFGRYAFRDDIGPIFEVDGTSFNIEPERELFYINVTGTLMNKNTIEDFKNIDKAALLNSIGEVIWSNIKTDSWINNPSRLLNFFILSFADLKKFHYYFWLAFPSPSQPVLYTKASESLTTHFNTWQISTLCNNFKQLDNTQKCFFIVSKDTDNIQVNLLSSILKQKENQNDLDVDLTKTYFVFADSSNNENPGWSLRLFLAALLEHWPMLFSLDFHVIGLRCKKDGSINSSRVFTILASQATEENKINGWVGWERNGKGNFGPRLANMSASMDPIKLADTSSDLNIKLMQWRLVPDLNIEIMKSTKCLLLGAGTLGCHVARDLLAWGFRHITLIDNGKVSFSNPTRQVLFNFDDCLNGGKKKAEAAAEGLKRILPTVQSLGYALHIPTPGHPIGESLKQEVIENIAIITEAISTHDVIFLLLDTREARWLPTLLGACHGKIVINAALGFDSYLVMRHGAGASAEECAGGGAGSGSLPGEQLACYFCSDVTAPGNSLKDRTLDQQCTVTRPGVAAIAAALAVEVLVALLQHPLRINAPALYNVSGDKDSDLDGILGPIPHSIRGFLHSYETVMPTCAKFKQCIACSDIVLSKYKAEGTDFLLRVFNSGKYLEEMTGLSDLHLSAEMSEILTLSDEE